MVSVLIVEDDITIADLLQEVLEADGYKILAVARTVDAAMASVSENRPDYAVIDVHLAKGGLGTEVGAHLRKTTKTGILFSTGNDGIDSLTSLQGHAVITKPYRLDDVGRSLKIISELMEFGATQIAYPRNFRMLSPAPVLHDAVPC